ncbi:diguanylate cyclase [Candidatus Koribacter versatilis Ellin345]|uniref:diguanylate cyclase n=1 Tax=Koribacter versatilis (strain Ellin345) TaxID=204669 RepID=Q1IJ19_KORVE|nr:sensor domain-containing diguanylate cyclase [Candidatus Koribacter versatilis]ABF43131.1 diguanylate cyclase [Candidatus Koribacter versatilis Ellin345]
MLPDDATDSIPPERFVVEVFSELDQATVQRRWREVNTILRLAMLGGMQIQLEATLNMLLDFAAEISFFEKSLVYFWEEDSEQVKLRLAGGMDRETAEPFVRGNIFNFWATRFGRPLLVTAGHNLLSDAALESLGARSALIVPLVVSNKVIGSMQLFSAEHESFTREDAQLFWMLTLVAENQLTRDYENEGLIKFAFTDFLTGLKTRGYFEQQLELEIKRAERKRTPIAMLMLDLDHFKTLNDTYGHHVGDQVLRDVSAVLMKDLREVDTAARYGGEEFVIVLPETNTTGAMQVANRIRRGVEQAKFFAGSPRQVERLTISIGIAIYDQDAQSKRELIEAADAALYQAKGQGRNQVVTHAELGVKKKEVS